MAGDVGKAEFGFGIAPVVFLRRNAGDDFQRALADLLPVIVVPIRVVQESVRFAAGICSFHQAVYCHFLRIWRNFWLLKNFRPVAVSWLSSAKQASSTLVKLKQAFPCMRFFKAGDMPLSSSGAP